MSSPTMPRREFLATGLAAAGSALLSGSILSCTTDSATAPPPPTRTSTEPSAPAVDGDLADPRVIRSVGGVLSATIKIASDPVRVAGAPRFAPITYGNTIPGPTLRVNAGDTLDLTFADKIMIGSDDPKPGYGRPPRPASSATNVHYHGTHVTPVGTGDNMLVKIHAGESFTYHFQVPPTHPAGLFWYHPHVHGLVTEQLGRGGCGMLFIANAHTGAVDARYRRRILVLQQLYLEPDLRTITFDDADRDDPLLALTLINGELMPLLRMRPGERQVWDLANASTSAFYQLRVPDGFQARVLAYDGLPRTGYPGGTGPTIQLAPGKRVELEVKAPVQPGTTVLSLDAYNQGVDTWPAKPIATIAIGGTAVADPGEVPLDPSGLPDLSGAAPVTNRTIIFDQDDSVPEGEFGRFRMYLQGHLPHSWNPAVPEWTDSILGTVEQWTILNLTAQEHPFHVHTNPIHVMTVAGPYNGVTPSPSSPLVTGYHDTVVVPPGGYATVRTRFADFTGGPILMHCHILDHEDMGMMTSFFIQPATTTT